MSNKLIANLKSILENEYGKFMEIAGIAGIVYSVAKTDHELIGTIIGGIAIYAGEKIDSYVKESKFMKYVDKRTCMNRIYM